MKSAHRHELETNALAHRLEGVIDRLRPYSSTIIGSIAAAVILILLWSWISGASSSQRGAAWNEYHQAVGSARPDLEALNRFGEAHPGTEMQQLADITYADGQAFQASANYFYNRGDAKEALTKATSAYQRILNSSNNERLLNRAHLGMARVYEMQNDLAKAKAEYEKVGGGYAEFAKAQIKRLDKPETKETLDWLAKAEPPRTQPPTGPGVPGRHLEFSPGDLSLPEATQGTDTTGTGTADPGASFDEMLKGLRLDAPAEEGAQRYDSGLGTPVQSEEVPAKDPNATIPPTGTTSETPADGTNATPPADSGTATQPSGDPATPAAEKPAE
jgi:tetratricopeptide (TPR) repeat protein